MNPDIILVIAAGVVVSGLIYVGYLAFVDLPRLIRRTRAEESKRNPEYIRPSLHRKKGHR